MRLKAALPCALALLVGLSPIPSAPAWASVLSDEPILSETPDVVSTAPVLDALVASPETVTLTQHPWSRSIQIKARYSDSSVVDVTPYVTWTYSQPDIVVAQTFETGSVLQALWYGETVVSATYGGKTTTIPVIVANVNTVTMTPNAATAKPGDIVNVDLVATLDNEAASSVSVRDEAVWQSSNETIAAVKGPGRIAVGVPGQAIVTATFHGVEYHLVLTVEAPAPAFELALRPESAELFVGAEEDVSLFAVYADGAEQDVTLEAEWASSDENVAVVEGGTVTAVGEGEATVTASFGDVEAAALIQVASLPDEQEEKPAIVIDPEAGNVVTIDPAFPHRMNLRPDFVDSLAETLVPGDPVRFDASSLGEDVALNVSSGSLLALGEKFATLELAVDGAEVALPAAAIDMEGVAAELGTSADSLEVTIARATPPDQAQSIADAAAFGFDVAQTPDLFAVTIAAKEDEASFGAATVSILSAPASLTVEHYDDYVTQTVALSPDVDPARAMVVMYADGLFTPIPASFENGQATFSVTENASYLILERPEEAVTDVPPATPDTSGSTQASAPSAPLDLPLRIAGRAFDPSLADAVASNVSRNADGTVRSIELRVKDEFAGSIAGAVKPTERLVFGASTWPSFETMTVDLPASLVASIAGAGAALAFETSQGAYEFDPASFGVSDWLASLDLTAEARASIVLTPISPEESVQLRSAAADSDLHAIALPSHRLAISVDIEGRTYDYDEPATGYTTYRLPAPADAFDPSKAAAVALRDGRLAPLPLRIEDGKLIVRSADNEPFAVVTREALPLFDDSTNHWAQDEIAYLANRFVVAGDGSGAFAPDAPITRAEFAALLVRALGVAPAPSNGTTFEDVAPDAWYAGEIEAAVRAGLFRGLDAERFAPEQSMTREQMTVVLVRAMRGFGLDAAATNAAAPSDLDQSSAWAMEDLEAALAHGLVRGDADGALDPLAQGTRAQAAVMLANFLERTELGN